MTKPCDRGAVCAAILGLMMLLPVQAATAEVQAFTDKAEWIEAVGDFAFIDFVGIPGGTFLSDEFEQLGVNFTPGRELRTRERLVFRMGLVCFRASFYSISFTLAEPQYWVAVDLPRSEFNSSYFSATT